MIISLPHYDKEKALQLYLKKKNYYSTHCLRYGDSQIRLEDIVINAHWNTKKYAAMISDRVRSLKRLADQRGLCNLLLTLTLPSEYHPYSLRNGKKISNPKFANRHIEVFDLTTRKKAKSYRKMQFRFNKKINNKKWPENYDEVSLMHEDYSAKKGAEKLQQMFRKIVKDRRWSRIPAHNRIYCSMIEPTQNLVPHRHFSIWVPYSELYNLSHYICKNFPAPLAHIYSRHFLDSEEGKQIQKCDKDLVVYPFKLLWKLEDNGKINDLSLWYLLNGIRLFSSSRSLVPEDIYRKLDHQKITRSEATELYLSKEITAWTDRNVKSLAFVFIHGEIVWASTGFVLEKIRKKNEGE